MVGNGWSVYPEAVTNPWIVPQQRGHYWDEGLTGACNAQRWEALLGISKTFGLNIGGTQEADL
ncbi:hypothetical protein [Salinibaculum salinum]|uniref:hypothetical protein n=1 Tax=Salinibaculum salinum TaxID=3131996 RepID=UPI0030EEEA41